MKIPKRAEVRPTLVTPVLLEFDAATLIRRLDLPSGDLAGFTFDLDGTLVKTDENHIPMGTLRFLSELRGAGMRLGFIADIDDRDGQIDPSERQRRAEDLAKEASDFCNTGIIATISGPQHPRKPDEEVFERARANLGLNRRRIVHVGDRLLQDVRGANLAGYAGSVLVGHYGPYADWREQFREAVVRRVYGVPLLSRNFGEPTIRRNPA